MNKRFMRNGCLDECLFLIDSNIDYYILKNEILFELKMKKDLLNKFKNIFVKYGYSINENNIKVRISEVFKYYREMNELESRKLKISWKEK